MVLSPFIQMHSPDSFESRKETIVKTKKNSTKTTIANKPSKKAMKPEPVEEKPRVKGSKPTTQKIKGAYVCKRCSKRGGHEWTHEPGTARHERHQRFAATSKK